MRKPTFIRHNSRLADDHESPWLFGIGVFLILSLLAGLTMTPVPSAYARLQSEKPNDILAKKVTLTRENTDVSFVLRALSAASHVPIGFQSADLDANVRSISIKVVDGTVKDVLDQLIQTDERYKWELDNGVINFLPKHSKISFLDVVVAVFNFKDGDAEDVPRAILSLPEVQIRFSELGLKEDTAKQYEGPVRNLQQFSLQMRNATVREILNEIVRRRHSTFWKIRIYVDVDKSASISL